MRPNVILIVLDTLRKDYCAGLKKLLKLGFVEYDNAIATAPWTVPSHASIFTGLMPSEHGIHERVGLDRKQIWSLSRYGLANQRLRLLDGLTERGYSTYELTCNPWVSSQYGYSFEYCKEFNEFGDVEKTSRYSNQNTLGNYLKMLSDRELALMLRRISKRLSKYLGVYPLEKGSFHVLRELGSIPLKNPFFLFLNLMEAHNPYSWTDIDWGNQVVYSYLTGRPFTGSPDWKERYTKHADYAVSRGLAAVSLLSDAFDESIIIVTSDHGQLIGEKNRYDHNLFLDDELLRVPFYVRYPKGFQALEKRGNYLSLLEIPRLIEAVVEGKNIELGSDIAMAESFGPQADISFLAENETETNLLAQGYFRRVKVYAVNGSALYNESADKLEESNGEISLEEVKNAISKLKVNEKEITPTSGAPFDPEEEKVIMSRLRDLGYA